MHARATSSALFVHNPLMIRKGHLIRSSCAEQTCVSTLSLHVDDCTVSDMPILWRPRATAEHQTKRDVSSSSYILLGADGCPHAEIIDKVKQLVVCPIPDQWREYFSKKSTLDPSKLATTDVWLLQLL